MSETHGGARDGAGRKRIGNELRIKTSVSLDADSYDALQDENKSGIINAGLNIVIPAIQGDEEKARQNFEDFLNERK